MKSYTIEVRDLTDMFLFGDLTPLKWGEIMDDIVVKYVGTAFLEGFGVDRVEYLSDRGVATLKSLFGKHLDIIDDLTDEASDLYRRHTINPYVFKSKVLLTVLGLKSAWLIGREISS